MFFPPKTDYKTESSIWFLITPASLRRLHHKPFTCVFEDSRFGARIKILAAIYFATSYFCLSFACANTWGAQIFQNERRGGFVQKFN